MRLNVGDKVKFLNAKGGGVVKKIIDSRMVLLTIESGFDIPTLISDLIRTGDEESAGTLFRDPVKTELPAKDEETVRDSSSGDLSPEVIRSRKSEDIYLGFQPHDQKWLITGMIDVILINNTSADILYNIFRKNPEKGYSGTDYGSVPAGSRWTVATIEREELPDWIEGTIQFLFHKNECVEVPMPFNAEYSIQGPKFYSENNYKESRFLEGKSIVVRIATLISPSEYEDIQVRRNPLKQAAGDDFIMKHRTTDREAEVDLHITELVEDSSVLEKSEILEFQKNYFIRCLDSAIVNHFRKVIFIHGVGNGVLREVLLDHLLKQKGIDVFDAPMKNYGVGAIEVRIAHNQ